MYEMDLVHGSLSGPSEIIAIATVIIISSFMWLYIFKNRTINVLVEWGVSVCNEKKTWGNETLKIR